MNQLWITHWTSLSSVVEKRGIRAVQMIFQICDPVPDIIAFKPKLFLIIHVINDYAVKL